MKLELMLGEQVRGGAVPWIFKNIIPLCEVTLHMKHMVLYETPTPLLDYCKPKSGHLQDKTHVFSTKGGINIPVAFMNKHCGEPNNFLVIF